MMNRSILLTLAMSATLSTAYSQTVPTIEATHTTPVAASAATVIQALVRYAGTDQDSSGKAGKTVNFLIFKDEKAGEPLWTETQTIAFDAAGRYEVSLGATYSSGLPPGLFGTGEARWLEVQIAGETPGARTLLTSVPYALKAADAAMLSGLPASAFALAGTTGPAVGTVYGIVTDASAASVTTTGGTNFYLPKFNAATTVVNSEIYDSGTSGRHRRHSELQKCDDLEGLSVVRVPALLERLQLVDQGERQPLLPTAERADGQQYRFTSSELPPMGQHQRSKFERSDAPGPCEPHGLNASTAQTLSSGPASIPASSGGFMLFSMDCIANDPLIERLKSSAMGCRYGMQFRDRMEKGLSEGLKPSSWANLVAQAKALAYLEAKAFNE